jgi:hypothetical protein
MKSSNIGGGGSGSGGGDDDSDGEILFTLAEENRLQMHSVSILSISQGLVWNLCGGQRSRFCIIMFILKFEISIN